MPRFSATLMDHFTTPRNSGRLAVPDRVGVSGAPNAGPFTRLELAIRNGVITDARFQTHGCGSAIACGSVLTVLIIGRTLTEAGALRPEQIVEALDGLPDDKRHCAHSAITALKNALIEPVDPDGE